MLHHATHADTPSSASLPTFNPAIPPAFDMKLDFFEALSRGDVAKAASTFAEEGTLLFPGLRPVVGRPLVKRMLGIIRRRYEDITWTPAGPAIASGAWIVASWTVSGTFKDSGLAYVNEGVSLIQLDADGTIKLFSDYFKDTQSFLPARAPVTSANRIAA